VHRRNFIAGSTAVGMSAMLPQPAAAVRGDTLEDVLFGTTTAEPLPAGQLAAQIAAARTDYRAARYSRLARRLPNLLAQAIASRAVASADDQAAAASRLAQAYGVATQLLIKLHDNGMAYSTAERAVRAASAGTDPLVLAESHRLAATVLRRTDHGDTAQRLVLDAAEQLRTTTMLPDPEHHALYGQLLAVAAYTAAIHDDRDGAWTLLGEAEPSAGAAGRGGQFNNTEVAVYRISIARKLGDYGAAVDYARKVDPRRITAPERRARYWEDTALALHGRGRPAGAFDALRAAEGDVPEEVQYRPWARQLTQQLLSGSTSLPGLREFASRIGVV
jgi:tetratricopeptide (TPR) repeat protein